MLSGKGTACVAQLAPAELVALIAAQLVAGRGDSSATVISESVEAAVRIVDAAEAAIAARYGPGREGGLNSSSASRTGKLPARLHYTSVAKSAST
jgi:hypothetical protein